MNILYSRCRKIWEKFGFFATFFLLKEVAFSQIWKSLNGSHSLPRSVHCERSQIRTRDICVSSLEWHQGATTTPIYFTYCIWIFVLVSIKRKCYMTVTHIVHAVQILWTIIINGCWPWGKKCPDWQTFSAIFCKTFCGLLSIMKKKQWPVKILVSF